ncbi:MAG: hypothetical protein COU31_00730 [Candidatus Magasanikbacteria bacterium CG10_big_fil_rev_8_21_14_0_10_40_10]|uniref:AtpZ/AtpI family protein n=1 Tax=Candidatus Magasanikbacteria bacterium CG10_big_fil_rev_8_21_14_0_10_40_10 TaxID=1974648 RepID=A0A2M6W4X9_9BACT|nr:MAG: hypothetical protein COU31_00730 [Candidatus Magasanikbacteria bacterium CG10_big_fil_rev_8_21_14_0_10_40_10]
MTQSDSPKTPITGQTNKKTTDRDYYLFALRIIGDFGATIAVPVILFVLIGQYLDDKYELGPYITILAFTLSALFSGIMIHKKAKIYGEIYQKMVDNEKK